MDFWRVLEDRHSVRGFTAEPVPRETIDRIVHAASLAPSAYNLQPWRFHVTTGDARAAIGEIVSRTTGYLSEYLEVLAPENCDRVARWYSTLGDAPVVIAVTAPTSNTELEATNALIAIGAAIENLLLAATAEGVAACNITAAYWVRDDIEELLGVRGDRRLTAIVALGFPSADGGTPPAKRTDVAEWLD